MHIFQAEEAGSEEHTTVSHTQLKKQVSFTEQVTKKFSWYVELEW